MLTMMSGDPHTLEADLDISSFPSIIRGSLTPVGEKFHLSIELAPEPPTPLESTARMKEEEDETVMMNTTHEEEEQEKEDEGEDENDDEDEEEEEEDAVEGEIEEEEEIDGEEKQPSIVVDPVRRLSQRVRTPTSKFTIDEEEDSSSTTPSAPAPAATPIIDDVTRHDYETRTRSMKRQEQEKEQEQKQMNANKKKKTSTKKKAPTAPVVATSTKKKQAQIPKPKPKVIPTATPINERRRKSTAAANESASKSSSTSSTSSSTSTSKRLLHFPSVSDIDWSEYPFEHSFATFINPEIDLTNLSSSSNPSSSHPPSSNLSRAPSSQPLHVTRLHIYRELCEEYFGRFLKDTPDLLEDEIHKFEQRSVQRSSIRVHSKTITTTKRETPEQLRMIFCQHLNRCEEDRVASSAGKSEKTGIIMVNPLTLSQQLKSLAASDAASVQRAIDENARVPATHAEYLQQLKDQRVNGPGQIGPTQMNPNFDLYQYAPFVATDQYEEICDDLQFQLQQSEDEHPTLPAYHIAEAERKATAAKAAAAAATAAAESATATAAAAAAALPPPPAPAAVPVSVRLTPSASASLPVSQPPISLLSPLRPLGPYGASHHHHGMPAVSPPPLSHWCDSDMEEHKSAIAPSAIERAAFAAEALHTNENHHQQQQQFHNHLEHHSMKEEEDDDDEEKPPPLVSISDTSSFHVEPNHNKQSVHLSRTNNELPPSKTNADVQLVDTLAPALMPASAPVAMVVDSVPPVSSDPAPSASAVASSSSAAPAAPASSAPSAVPSISSPLLDPTTPVCSLPDTSHGVGMFGSLDFNSPRCGQFKSHWTNSCFSWKFDNLGRTFSAMAYDASNRKHNDIALVTGIIQQSQREYHQALKEDELEEESLGLEESNNNHNSNGNTNRPKRQKRQDNTANGEVKDEMNDTPSSSSSSSPRSSSYSQGSPEYCTLRSRIRAEFETAMSHSLFLPHTFMKDVAPRLHARATAMSRECVNELQRRICRPKDEQPVDEVFGLVVPGFGTKGTQVFLKIGLCVTLLHDEIAWCSALNYMTVRSRGCALWIGLNMHKASVKFSKDKLRHLIDAHSFNLSEFMHQLKKAGLQPSMQLQFPGTCIFSPQGRGSAHIVITLGSWIEQIAINDGISPSGLLASVNFWDGVEPLLHNSALATRYVVPMLWLQQHQRWKVGVEDQLRVLKALVEEVRLEGDHEVYYRDYSSTNDQETYCNKCFNEYSNRRAILYVRIDAMCPSCFVDTHPRYTHFATMIDRRFK